MTLNYKRFCTTEIAQFARDRNLNVEVRRPKRKRRCYLRALIDADNNTTFRFFDLPAEMRNSVYECLLTLRELKHGWKCYPEILATCKQVNREARDYLTVGNHSIVEMRLSPDFYPPNFASARWLYKSQATVNGHAAVHDDYIRSYWGNWKLWNTSPFVWPSVLLNSKRIDISISVEGSPAMQHTVINRDYPVLVNNALYDLYHALLEAGQMPDVAFTIRTEIPGMSPETIYDFLSPLALFDAPKKLECANTPSGVRSAAELSMATIESQFRFLRPVNQLKRWYALRKEVARLDCHRVKTGAWLISTNENYIKAFNVFNSLYGIMTVTKERSLSIALNRLEEWLDQDDEFMEDRHYIARLEKTEQSVAELRAKGRIY
ncbi:hypothetical protein D0863_02446 [Hortaea werneckii]|uniref:Uncharacterized protein n=1 Tax=Hortaea werneckii TaxID=91943 RepID=A0A3M7EHW8_HORWE|nr:hypothetical protein D0863_02446 [Hortaea werneckii]